MSLKLDWASYEAAKYAVENWHYSRRLPAGKLVKIGVWENEKFIGVVIFSRGANSNLGAPYGLSQTESCELTRIALTSHKNEVTKIVSIAIKMFKKICPGIQLIISFADSEQNHHGGIYQGGNWIYLGMTKASPEYLVNGKRMHGRSMRFKYGTHIGKDFIKPIMGSSKYRYLYPMNEPLRKKLEKLRKPYPKRVSSNVSVASGHQPEEGGAIPTDTLQKT